MLGIGKIEIEEATYSLGMCGHIVFRTNRSGQRYRVTQSMSEGLLLSEYDRPSGEWRRPRPVSDSDLVNSILPRGEWTMVMFIAAWAGFAAGFERGVGEQRTLAGG